MGGEPPLVTPFSVQTPITSNNTNKILHCNTRLYLAVLSTFVNLAAQISLEVQAVITVAMTKVVLICDALLCMTLCYVKSIRNAIPLN